MQDKLTLILGSVTAVLIIGMGATALFEAQGDANHLTRDSFVDATHPDMPERLASNEPLDLEEKAALAPLLPASLPILEGGWELRPSITQDTFDLRPDLGPCAQSPFAPCGEKSRTAEMWTYARGDERIIVMIQYHRNRREFPLAKTILEPKSPRTVKELFHFDSSGTDWAEVDARAGFKLLEKAAPRQAEENPPFHRFNAVLKNDGKVDVFIGSNTDREVTLSVLDHLDTRLISALTSSARMTEADAVASLSERQSTFQVISEAELRAKVAAMTSDDQKRIMSKLMADALRKGRSPEDYEITFHKTGDEGAAAAVAFLTGKIAKDAPEYDLLRHEHKERLPAGTCLLTRATSYCGESAELMRVANEVRRQNHAAKE
ncbi:MAG: hypothetical protein AAGF55_12410 [Pseudomonadota bacterium]